MQRGSLAGILRNDPAGEFVWDLRGHEVALDIANGIAFLHSVNIVHR